MTIAELAEELYGEWRRWSEVFGASETVPPQWRHLTTNTRGRWERVARAAYDALKATIVPPETACPDCDGSGVAADSAVGPVPCTNRVYHP